MTVPAERLPKALADLAGRDLVTRSWCSPPATAPRSTSVAERFHGGVQDVRNFLTELAFVAARGLQRPPLHLPRRRGRRPPVRAWPPASTRSCWARARSSARSATPGSGPARRARPGPGCSAAVPPRRRGRQAGPVRDRHRPGRHVGVAGRGGDGRRAARHARRARRLVVLGAGEMGEGMAAALAAPTRRRRGPRSSWPTAPRHRAVGGWPSGSAAGPSTSASCPPPWPRPTCCSPPPARPPSSSSRRRAGRRHGAPGRPAAAHRRRGRAPRRRPGRRRPARRHPARHGRPAGVRRGRPRRAPRGGRPGARPSSPRRSTAAGDAAAARQVAPLVAALRERAEELRAGRAGALPRPAGGPRPPPAGGGRGPHPRHRGQAAPRAHRAPEGRRPARPGASAWPRPSASSSTSDGRRRPPALRAATRGSPLARCAGRARGRPAAGGRPGVEVEAVVVETAGDRRPTSPSGSSAARGVFVKEVQAAVLDGRADIAVHSAKDLPSTPRRRAWSSPPCPSGATPATPWSGGTLDDLPAGGRVGTGSVRRRAQLAWLRPDLTFAGLRGNMETRLAKAAEFDAIVVAAAALAAAGPQRRAVAEVLDPELMLPQVGPGRPGRRVPGRRRRHPRRCWPPSSTARRAWRSTPSGPSSPSWAAAATCPVGAYAVVDGDGTHPPRRACSPPATAASCCATRDDGRRPRRRSAAASPATSSTTPAAPTSSSSTCAERSPTGRARQVGDRVVTVYLVGAGPGDPGLLTVRGAEVLAAGRRGRLRPAVRGVAARPGAGRRPSASTWASRRGRPSPRTRSTPCSSSGAGPARRSCGSRAATRSCSAGAARRRQALAGGRRPLRGRPRRHVGGGRARLRRRPGHPPGPVHVVHRRHRPQPPRGRRRHRLGGGGPGRRHHRRAHGRGPPGRDRRPPAWPAGCRPTRRWPPSGGAPGPSSARCAPRSASWPRAPWSRPSPSSSAQVAGLDLRVVRAPAAVRPAGGGHPGPRPGVGAGRPAARPGRRDGRAADHRDRRPGRRRRGAAGGRRPGAATTTGSCFTSANAVERFFACLRDARAFGRRPGGRRRAGHGRRPGRRRRRRRPRARPRRWPRRWSRPSPTRRRPGRVLAAPGRRRPAGPGRRPAGQGLGGRRGRGLPHRPGHAAGRRCWPRRPRPTPSPSPRRRRSTDYLGRRRRRPPCPRVVACIGPVTAAAAPSRAASPSPSRPTDHTVDGLVDALVAVLAA